MRYLPVHWSEGMFLRPHHFQAADRHWNESLATATRWVSHYHYGLRHIEISREALANQQLQVTRCSARFADGTLFDLQVGQELDRVDLQSAFERESRVTAYLALPKMSLGRPNVGLRSSDADYRFAPIGASLQDESSGGNDQSIELREAACRLVLSTEETAGLELLPVARIKRVGSSEGVPELDDDFYPPLLAVDAWPGLHHGLVRPVFDIIGEKVDVLAQRAANRGINLTSHDPGDLDDLFMLSSLNQAYATLHTLTFAHGVHPFWVYTELCRVVGMLSLFDATRRVSDELPPYDHDDLARIFQWVRSRIEQLLGSRKRLDYQQRFFVGSERGLQVRIEPEWLHAGWRWYVGVNGENIGDEACRELLRPGKLDWKMGSAQQVDLIFKHGVPGVEQRELGNPPRALPSRQGWVYYEVIRDGNAWKDVLATESLALRFRTELIGNIDKLVGQQRLEVMQGDKRVGLQFALFAVKEGAS